MAIIYPISTTAVASTASDTGARYKFYLGAPQGTSYGGYGIDLITGVSYTASLTSDSTTTSYLAFTQETSATSSISIQMPTSSLLIFGDGVQITPSIEFFRADDNDCEIKLVTQTGTTTFGSLGSLGGTETNELILPPLSYTNLFQIDRGGGYYLYAIAEQSKLDTGPRSDRYLNTGSNYTFATNNEKILINNYSGSTIVLPDATAWSRRLDNKITIKAIGSGSCTISGSGSDTIDGSSTYLLQSGSAVTIAWHYIDGSYKWISI